VVLDRAVDDWSRPLQLLARSLEFTDPLSGRPRRFESRRSLQAWTAYGEWLGATPGTGTSASMQIS
jgi:tRNA pseudouridine32 synthase/23S rRNA pseudouridine746 synthase